MPDNPIPGPWKWHICFDANDKPFANLHGFGGVKVLYDCRIGGSKLTASMRLIEAAPELLEACRAVSEALDWYFQMPDVLMRANLERAHEGIDAAIAKAEGGANE